MTEDLRAHLALCEEMLELVTGEGEALRGGDVFAGDVFSKRREALLPRLTESLEALRRVREAWQGLDPAARARQGDAEALMRRNQDLIMRIIVLDRENEQALLRRGLVPPAQLPASQRQRPHLVAARYFQNIPTDPRDPSACPSSAS
jgi:hypothetical protein